MNALAIPILFNRSVLLGSLTPERVAPYDARHAALVDGARALERDGRFADVEAERGLLLEVWRFASALVSDLGPAWFEQRSSFLDAEIERVGLMEFAGHSAQRRMAFRFVGDALRALAAIVADFDVVLRALTPSERAAFVEQASHVGVDELLADPSAFDLLRLELALTVCASLVDAPSDDEELTTWARRAATAGRQAEARIRMSVRSLTAVITEAQAKNAWSDWTDEDIAYEFREHPFGDRRR